LLILLIFSPLVKQIQRLFQNSAVVSGFLCDSTVISYFEQKFLTNNPIGNKKGLTTQRQALFHNFLILDKLN